MALLAVLSNPERELSLFNSNPRGAETPQERELLRLIKAFPQIRTKISRALVKTPVKVDISGPHGEYVRFRLAAPDPRRYELYRLMVLSPKDLIQSWMKRFGRRPTPTEAKRALGPIGLKRLTLGVIARRRDGGSELQSVLVPKQRVFEVARKYERRRIAINPRFKSRAVGGRISVSNPLTGSETRDVLDSARSSAWVARHRKDKPPIERGFFAGMAFGRAKTAELHGPKKMLGRALRVGAYSLRLLDAIEKESAGKNPGGDSLRIPFRAGRKYSPKQIEAWIRKHGSPAMIRRWEQAVAQYKRFHKGAMPKSVTYLVQKIGVSPDITDVEFGVSEGKEWMAPYQVPVHSGKHEGGQTQGRYIHAHGDAVIDVNIRKPAPLRKLPDRFHTPDGKFVGVIPKVQKITDWYYR